MELLALLLLTFPTFQEEFQEFEESYHEFYNDDLIATASNNTFLAYIHDFSENKYPVIETFGIRHYQFKTQPTQNIPFSLESHIKPSSTVIDYNAGQGLFTLACTSHLGLTGKLIAFEPNHEDFKALYWNLTLNQIQNAKLYCNRLNDKTNTLDALHLDNVSFIRINMLGNEIPFLKGAQVTIRRCKPILYLKLPGSLSLSLVDKYTKQIITQHLDYIHQLGYETQPLSPSEYLALPR